MGIVYLSSQLLCIYQVTSTHLLSVHTVHTHPLAPHTTYPYTHYSITLCTCNVCTSKYHVVQGGVYVVQGGVYVLCVSLHHSDVYDEVWGGYN